MKRLLTVCLNTLLVLTILIPKTEAHLGSSPPFVVVNGKYAQNNPLFQAGLTQKGLNLPQDSSPDVYVINSSIHLFVDTSQLSINPAIVDQVEFRWTFSRGTNFENQIDQTVTGKEITKSFSKAGSYLVTLAAKSPGHDYNILDTIELQIVPSKNYPLPKSAVQITSALQSGTTTIFTNTANAPDATFLWDFDENKVERGKTISKVFSQSYFYAPVIARVIDKNGLISDTGIYAIGDKRKISFSLINTNENPKDLVVQHIASPSFFYSIGGGIVVISIIGGYIFFRRKRR